MPNLSRRPEWRALKAHARAMREVRIADLLAGDGERVARFTLELDGLLVDFSKQRVSGETMDLLHALAAAVGVESWTRRLFAGEKINATEGRAALHVALRDRSGEPVLVDGADVMPEVRRVLDRMRDFAEAVRAGKRCGHGGRRFRSVVNIGIGGSDLGPAMVCEALSPWCHPEFAFHFVSNVDGADIARVLAGLDPRSSGRGRGGAAFRRRLHQPGEGRRVRHRAGEHLRLLGVGRRALFPVVGRRAAGRA
jgi:glucose-6-phosphate isomerase